MFISKKKYQALLAERDRWEELAASTSAQNGSLLTELKEMHAIAKTVNDHNGQLIKQNKLLKEARDYAAGMADYYKDLLESKTDEEDLAYSRLETDYEKLREERDHYEERCRYLEDELAHYEAEEEGKYLTREAEE